MVACSVVIPKTRYQFSQREIALALDLARLLTNSIELVSRHRARSACETVFLHDSPLPTVKLKKGLGW